MLESARMKTKGLTLTEALRTGRLDDFVAQAEAEGTGTTNEADLHKAYLASIQPTKAENLRRSAANLRDLAARGMKVRAYPKMAAVMEAEADRLEGTA